MPEETRKLELIPFTINDTISRPSFASSSPGRLDDEKKSSQPTATDIVAIQQTESFLLSPIGYVLAD